MRIRLYPDKILKKVSRSVKDISKVVPLKHEMLGLMYANNGAALAAPQVGISKRFFVAEEELFGSSLVINPSWNHHEESQRLLLTESCLSFPGLTLNVLRESKINATFLDESGTKCTMILSGFAAHVFQHETDHLNGILFIDK